MRIDWIIWKIADPQTTNKNRANNHGPTGYWSSLPFCKKDGKILITSWINVIEEFQNAQIVLTKKMLRLNQLSVLRKYDLNKQIYLISLLNIVQVKCEQGQKIQKIFLIIAWIYNNIYHSLTIGIQVQSNE